LVNRDDERLNRQLDRLEHPPRGNRRPIHWLRKPSARWVRIPIGALLLLGGVFSIVSLPGLWMLPLELLLAQDIP
jgi:hypothetical protein